MRNAERSITELRNAERSITELRNAERSITECSSAECSSRLVRCAVVELWAVPCEACQLEFSLNGSSSERPSSRR